MARLAEATGYADRMAVNERKFFPRDIDIDIDNKEAVEQKLNVKKNVTKGQRKKKKEYKKEK